MRQRSWLCGVVTVLFYLMCTFNRVTREFPSLWKFQSSIWCNGNALVAGFVLALGFIVSPHCEEHTMKNLKALSFVEFRPVEPVLDEMVLRRTLLILGNSSGGNWYQRKEEMDGQRTSGTALNKFAGVVQF